MLYAQLEPEVISPNRRGAIRLDVAERPHVADMFEQWLAFLWAGRRPGLRHAADRGAATRLETMVVRRTTRAGILPRSSAAWKEAQAMSVLRESYQKGPQERCEYLRHHSEEKGNSIPNWRVPSADPEPGPDLPDVANDRSPQTTDHAVGLDRTRPRLSN